MKNYRTKEAIENRITALEAKGPHNKALVAKQRRKLRRYE